MTQVADEGALEGIRGAAAAAVLGVVGVLQLGQGLALVLDAEVCDPRPPSQLAVAAEVGDQGVIGAKRELDGRLRRADAPGVSVSFSTSSAHSSARRSSSP